jgi:replicative DNA helicase
MPEKKRKKEFERMVPSGYDPFTRTLPQSPDAERTVLSAILQNQALFHVVNGVVEPAHFGYQLHAQIYQAMQAIAASGDVIDSLSVSTWLVNEKVLPASEAGVATVDPKIEEIAGLLPDTNFDILPYAQRVRDWAARRKGIQILRVAIDNFYENDKPSETITELTKSLLLIRTSDASNLVPLSLGIDKVMGQFDAPREKQIQRVSETGFHYLDSLMGGIEERSITSVIARSKVGKSTLCGQFVLNDAEKTNNAQIYFLLEMDIELLVRRFLQQMTGLQIRQMLQGKVSMTENHKRTIVWAASELKKRNIYVVDNDCYKVSQMRAYVYQFMAKHPDKKIGWVVADHWNLFEGAHEVGQQEDNAKQFNDMIKETNTRGLLPAQCRKPDPGKEKTPPTMYDVKGSGALYEIVSNLLIIHRPNKGTETTGASDLGQLIYAAGREAEDGAVIPIRFDPDRIMFTEA